MLGKVTVIGAGLAGSEAAYFLATHNCQVDLYEMRPSKKAPAHHTGKFAELVCSNSLKSFELDTATGLLKEEMQILDSLVMKAAKLFQVPAGQALAVDREKFADYIDKTIRALPNVTVHHEEITSLPKDGLVIVATGPLTSAKFSRELRRLLGVEQLYFYDAAAPMVLKSSLDFNKCYYKSRYDKGMGDDYINCPMTKEEFIKFYQELVKGERVKLRHFEKEKYFEGCLPIEVIARRGAQTLTFGPMRPVGLERENAPLPYAVVQLRQDDSLAEVYNMVGFQTNLTFPEQERIFRLIPGLEKASFVRFGVMHRNTFINSPLLLTNKLTWRQDPRVFFAGQLIGVEGYIESACSGLFAAINAWRQLQGLEMVALPKETVIGSLVDYVVKANPDNFQPMNANYGVLNSPLKDKMAIAELSLAKLREWRDKYVDCLSGIL